ncbi:MAG: GNAT family N-acetyltransferase, partial [Halomonas sp.]|nr:GNAT family N-acetyltransferase [Halomonas sp.]
IARLLHGYRRQPAVDIEALTVTLMRVSQLVATLERVVELDINPLLADASGVVALDARVVVRRERQPLAIRPYPQALERHITTRSGQAYLVRPIRPEDEPALVEMLSRSSPEDVRLRFFAAIKSFDHAFAARLTQIDYDREMAFVALLPESGELCGVVRLIADPDKEAAEYAVMVRSDRKQSGLGYTLMGCMIEHARMLGIRRIFADVLRENEPMLKMARELGFAVVSGSSGEEVVQVELFL